MNLTLLKVIYILIKIIQHLNCLPSKYITTYSYQAYNGNVVTNPVSASISCDSTCSFDALGNYCLGSSQNCNACQSQYAKIDASITTQFSIYATCNQNKNAFGYYFNQANNILYQCNPQCYRCVDGGTCESCQQNYVYIQSTKSCVSQCPTGQYPDENRLCQQCPQGCSRCINYFICVQCQQSTYYLQYFYNSTSQQGQYNCTTTLTNQFPQQDNLYPISDSQPNQVSIFEQCDPQCNGCQNASQNCIACQPNYSSNQSNQATFFCVQSCNDGFYYQQSNTQKQCQPCSNKCVSCTTNPGCDRCSSDTYKQLNAIGANECVNVCQDGYYADQILLECLKCDQSCATCFGPSSYNCLTCSTNYYKAGSYQCIQPKCGDGILTQETEQCDDGNNLNNDGCSSTCQIEPGWKCCIANDPDPTKWICSFYDQSQGNYNQLLNLIYYKSKCLTTCGDGFRVGPQQGGTEQCDVGPSPTPTAGCDSNCQIENGYSCIGGSPTTQDVCTYLCSKQCITCQTNYLSNSQLTGTCIQCPQGMYAYQEQCLQKCPNNYFNDSTSGLGFCVQSCPSNSFINGQNCVTQCDPGQLINNNMCFDKCDQGTYSSKDPITSQITCSICHFSCLACSDGGPNFCTSCQIGYKQIDLGNNQLKCVLQCKNGYKQDPQNSNKCIVCMLNCDKCISPYYQYNDDCVQACPDGTFQNEETKTCDKFQNPKVSFIYDPPLQGSNEIGINQDYKITAVTSSVYPIVSMTWSIENQSPTFLSGLQLNTNSIIVRKIYLDYNMLITLKFVAQSTMGITTSFINLETFSKPVISINLLVNGKQQFIINHLSDTLTIQTKYWPTPQQISYQIQSIGQSTGKLLNIDSGSSTTDLSVKYIFPFLKASETYTIQLYLWNQNIQLNTTESLTVTTNSVPIRPLDQIFGKAFNLNQLTDYQVNTLISTIIAQYQQQLQQNNQFLNNLELNIYYYQKFSIPIKCRQQQLCAVGTCNDSTQNSLSCDCQTGYSGRFCSFTTDQFNQIQSLGTILNSQLQSMAFSEQQYIQIALNTTMLTDIGQNIFTNVGNSLSQYINKITPDSLINNYQSYIQIIGQIAEEQLVLSGSNSQQTQLFNSVYQSFQTLNNKRINALNQNQPFLSVNYQQNLYCYLVTFQVANITSPTKLIASSQWNLATQNNSTRRSLQVIQDGNKIFNLTGIIQNDVIETEVTIPKSIIKASSVQQVQLQIHRWQMNPRQSQASNMQGNLTNIETHFIEVQSNLNQKYINKNDNTTYILYMLPRIRNQIDDQTILLIENPFSCFSFDTTQNIWTNSTCVYIQQTYYHIYCSCPTINTVFFATRNFDLFQPLQSESLIALIQKLVSNSGLWMVIFVLLSFLMCWLGTKDSNDPDYIDKKTFRRLTPLLSVFFVRYPLKPVRFRIIQAFLTIFTQMLIESLLYLVYEDSFTIDAVPNYALYGVLAAIPFNYLVGLFSIWAQYSESEENIMLEIQNEKMEGTLSLYTYHIVSNQQEADAIKKLYQNKQDNKEIKISSAAKYSKYKQINKEASINKEPEAFSSIQNNTNHLHSNSSLNKSEQESKSIGQQPKILIMQPDLIKSRVITFIAVCILFLVAEAAGVLLLIQVNSNSSATGYFIGSVFVGFVIDFIFFDFSIALAAKYIKPIFKLITYRGIWFKMPKDIRMKKDYLAIQNENMLDKSSISSRFQNSQHHNINKSGNNHNQEAESENNNKNLVSNTKNINQLLNDRDNEDLDVEEINKNQLDQFKDHSEESSHSNHNF
ncbi:myxococcus cysteine-rich repeat protein (macronuclear) [Tetrahymena thermophila SB210]|uniref:Myxococcus cysteine-rich repeat protein n=1 Tax=Tetrahymena thermophila (strain SB210) TaxID=312017 RepID=W7XID2_TETTS|nr:myxococcus cysteine-rich repeat protein [Tetrahymena thermophila SB210]EWS73199.1 myxococcus cysteine-rich repeat protein [Tetrahymena thermophila SB210]|eukprot:XP_012654275.1 myxococcus cysteine-rich repeat protein [Tetrahymena thermophila SB210]